MPSINLARERALYTAFSDQAVQARQLQLARLQEQMSSGRRVLRASDDPSAFTEARHMELLTNRYEQYLRSITASSSWVDHTQDGLDRLAELFTEAYEGGVRMNNASFSDEDREAEARRLESILVNIVDVLNSKDGDEHVFAGSRTTIRPFTQDAGPPPVIQYEGNVGMRERHIGRDLTMAINIDGQRVHETGEGYTITEALQSLIDGLRSNDPQDIEAAIKHVAIARDHVIDLGAEAGATARRLEIAETQLRDASVLTEARRSDMEDLDFAEAAVDFQKTQIALQAAVQVSASILNTTLLDYLR